MRAEVGIQVVKVEVKSFSMPLRHGKGQLHSFLTFSLGGSE